MPMHYPFEPGADSKAKLSQGTQTSRSSYVSCVGTCWMANSGAGAVVKFGCKIPSQRETNKLVTDCLRQEAPLDPQAKAAVLMERTKLTRTFLQQSPGGKGNFKTLGILITRNDAANSERSQLGHIRGSFIGTDVL